MQPRLVIERVIADLMAVCGYRRDSIAVLFECRVLADYEECDLKFSFFKKRKDTRNSDVKIARQLGLSGVTAGLHIRPLIVEVERNARGRFHIMVDAGQACLPSERS